LTLFWLGPLSLEPLMSAPTQSARARRTLRDVSGNIVGYTRRLDSVSAAFEYSATGKLLKQTGAVGDFPLGYASQYTDRETGLVYYGLRYYKPDEGRFINRDPIGVAGGLNLYAMVGNQAGNAWDVLGLNSGPRFHREQYYNRMTGQYEETEVIEEILQLPNYTVSGKKHVETEAYVMNQLLHDAQEIRSQFLNGCNSFYVQSEFNGNQVQNDRHDEDGARVRLIELAYNLKITSIWASMTVEERVDMMLSIRMRSLWERDANGRVRITMTGTIIPGKFADYELGYIYDRRGYRYTVHVNTSGITGFNSNCHADSLGLRDLMYVDVPVMQAIINNNFYILSDETDVAFGDLVVWMTRAGTPLHSGTICSLSRKLSDCSWMGDAGGEVPPIGPFLVGGPTTQWDENGVEMSSPAIYRLRKLSPKN
jgi:RHS repeat-associated protein